MKRREFLVRSGVIAGVAVAPASRLAASAAAGPPAPAAPGDWGSFRGLFELDPRRAHFAGFFLASHPRPVREAIERHRAALDADPPGFVHEHRLRLDDEVRDAAGEYLGVDGRAEIALTDSTTMGLGLLYGGIKLRQGQEVLTTNHDHYSTHQSLRFRAARDGAEYRMIDLYETSAGATVDEVCTRLEREITPATRVVAVTWVASKTGVKLPISRMAEVIARANAGRDERDTALLCVDGVHGLGVENATLPELGCDFFVAGTHKWMLGPRGTGIWWGKPGAWNSVAPTIPPFGSPLKPSTLFTPGGFHSFEYRWAAADAFRLHLELGKAAVEERIHLLNGRIREGLAEMAHVRLHTPLSPEMASGLVCFDADRMQPALVIERLAAAGIVGSVSPYQPPCARLSASLWNTEEEVERAVAAVGEMA